MRQRVDTVNEGQDSEMEWTLFDKNGHAATPLSCDYRIDNPVSDAAIKPWTSAPFALNIVTIPITAAENTPVVTTVGEQRELTIKATHADGSLFIDSALYQIDPARFYP